MRKRTALAAVALTATALLAAAGTAAACPEHQNGRDDHGMVLPPPHQQAEDGQAAMDPAADQGAVPPAGRQDAMPQQEQGGMGDQGGMAEQGRMADMGPMGGMQDNMRPMGIGQLPGM
ncbi:hypothetical protein [Streptomyces sp. 891-h]|uniref:hypothetical protein n=1 Tax=Streptomyces sp. 891-h TaxID=2720714 RepID=UPI001FA944B2|nr:hypothetical protein [Streptomyces sp. 891-h]UNZ19540.1 hypothetical protein HC362_23390 [Streptomyces sp. 891-h]